MQGVVLLESLAPDLASKSRKLACSLGAETYFNASGLGSTM
jgi:hypothetical protein